MTGLAHNATGNILVIDDEAQITRVLRTVLTGMGYHVRTAADGIEALEALFDWRPDIVITDLSMPNLGGAELCQKLRKRLPTAYIIVLSVRNEEQYKVESLDAGADDYVTKPFSMTELTARIRSGLRRIAVSQASSKAEEREIAVGDFHINMHTRMVMVRGRNVSQLTPKEFELLCFLARNPKIVNLRAMLLAAVWGESAVRHNAYLHVLMHHLRTKIEPEDGSRRYILTEKWVGYRFEPEGICSARTAEGQELNAG
jgi:two-component system KDP operon response regulator KdpE